MCEVVLDNAWISVLVLRLILLNNPQKNTPILPGFAIMSALGGLTWGVRSGLGYCILKYGPSTVELITPASMLEALKKK